MPTTGRPLRTHSGNSSASRPLHLSKLWTTNLLGDIYATVLKTSLILWREWHPARCLIIPCANFEWPMQPFVLLWTSNCELASSIIAQGKQAQRSQALCKGSLTSIRPILRVSPCQWNNPEDREGREVEKIGMGQNVQNFVGAGWALDQAAPSHALCTPWIGATWSHFRLMIHNIVDFGSAEEFVISTWLHSRVFPYRKNLYSCIKLMLFRIAWVIKQTKLN